MAYMYCILSKDSNVVCNNVYSNFCGFNFKDSLLHMTTDQTVPSHKSQKIMTIGQWLHSLLKT